MKKKLVLIPKNIHYHCVVCDQKMELYDDAIARTINSPPHHGVAFTTHGNWGSQVWDMSPKVHAVICDSCFVAKSHRMLMEEEDRSGTKKVIKVRKNLLDWFKWMKEKKETDPENHSDSYFETVSAYFRNL